MEEIKLKYQEIINDLNLSIECPYKGCYSDRIAGFRWIKTPITNGDNFLPSLILDLKSKKPRRRNSLDDKESCSYCGLSMYNSEENAKKRFHQLPRRNQILLGYTHIAGGVIEKGDGLITKANHFGHFDLFEFENVDIISKFFIISDLI